MIDKYDLILVLVILILIFSIFVTNISRVMKEKEGASNAPPTTPSATPTGLTIGGGNVITTVQIK